MKCHGFFEPLRVGVFEEWIVHNLNNPDQSAEKKRSKKINDDNSFHGNLLKGYKRMVTILFILANLNRK